MKVNIFSKLGNAIGVIASVIGIWQGYDYAVNRNNSNSTEKKDITEIVQPINKSENTDLSKKNSLTNSRESENTSVPESSTINIPKPKGNSVALLLVSAKKQIQSDLQFAVSDLMLSEGINNSTTIMESSLPHYHKFRNANSTWLNEIKLHDNVSSYLIGQINEESYPSSANKKITVVNLSFNGRLVQLNPYQVHPIKVSKKGSSFNKMDAFIETNMELAKSITEQSIKILKGS